MDDINTQKKNYPRFDIFIPSTYAIYTAIELNFRFHGIIKLNWIYFDWENI